MATESLARSLSEQAIFAELTSDHVEFLSGCTKNVRCAEGEHLFREGDSADDLYLIRSGKVSLETHDPTRGAMVIETLHAGEILGWSTIFPPHKWLADARATKPTVAYSVDGDCLRTKLDQDHSFGYAFTRLMLKEVHRRLEHARLQVLDIYRAEP